MIYGLDLNKTHIPLYWYRLKSGTDMAKSNPYENSYLYSWPIRKPILPKSIVRTSVVHDTAGFHYGIPHPFTLWHQHGWVFPKLTPDFPLYHKCWILDKHKQSWPLLHQFHHQHHLSHAGNNVKLVQTHKLLYIIPCMYMELYSSHKTNF